MKFNLVKQTVNVVWISPIITPLMFSPEWFRRYELLRDEDINNSNINFGLDSITTDYGWLEINCRPTRATFQLSKIGLENSLSDLTCSIASMFEHAETKALGINTLFVYNFDDANDWEAIGNALVPKDLWIEDNCSKILQDDVSYHYGMKNLVIAIENINSNKNDIYKETINASYSPVRNKENVKYGLQIQYNHDLAVSDDNKTLDFTKSLVHVIPQQINEAMKNDIRSHESIFKRILS